MKKSLINIAILISLSVVILTACSTNTQREDSRGAGLTASNDSHAMQEAMNNKTYRSSEWINPQTGTRHAITPTSDVMAYNGYSDCRKYHASDRISGRTQTSDGVACRQSDGNWVSVN